MRVTLTLAVFAALVLFEACSVPGATGRPVKTAHPIGDTLTVAYEENGQVELTTPAGSRVYLDVWNGRLVSKGPSSDDVLLLTHSEREDLDFQASFPGPKLITEAGERTLGDLTVRSIEGSHTDEPAVPGEPASNYIMVFDAGGFRVADLGEEGEESLSDSQLAAIGQVDVAICPLTNTGGNDTTGRKAVDVIAQIKPRLVVASFTDLDTARLAASQWPVAYSAGPVSLSRSSIPGGTTVVFLGQMAENYGVILDARPW